MSPQSPREGVAKVKAHRQEAPPMMLALALLAALAIPDSAADSPADGSECFEKQVRPLLAEHCADIGSDKSESRAFLMLVQIAACFADHVVVVTARRCAVELVQREQSAFAVALEQSGESGPVRFTLLANGLLCLCLQNHRANRVA